MIPTTALTQATLGEGWELDIGGSHTYVRAPVDETIELFISFENYPEQSHPPEFYTNPVLIIERDGRDDEDARIDYATEAAPITPSQLVFGMLLAPAADTIAAAQEAIERVRAMPCDYSQCDRVPAGHEPHEWEGRIHVTVRARSAAEAHARLIELGEHLADGDFGDGEGGWLVASAVDNEDELEQGPEIQP